MRTLLRVRKRGVIRRGSNLHYTDTCYESPKAFERAYPELSSFAFREKPDELVVSGPDGKESFYFEWGA